MKKNLDITKPRYSEQILPVRWPFVILLNASVNCPFFYYNIIQLLDVKSPQLSLLCSTVLRINIKCQLIIRPGFCESGLKQKNKIRRNNNQRR